MICKVFPRIEGLVLDRFRALGKQVMQHQRAGQSGKLEELRGREIDWAQHQAGINGERDEYEAIARVLIDLAKLRWRVEEDRFGIELIAPQNTAGTALDIADYKETVRNELAPQLAEQFADPAVRKFIRQMEAPRPSTKKKPVSALIADGGELRARLLEAAETKDAERVRVLEKVVQPYLQLVESDERDEFTGHLLSDIWRYFRFTWTIPATNIPGRQLYYLVRDAAHPNHAVIGIAALCNSPLQMRERDTALGWTVEAFSRDVEEALAASNAADALAERIQPAAITRGIIAPEQEEIRFEFLGETGGFGTVQFPEETTRSVQRVLVKDTGFRDVNSIFGEGRSPKFRMMRAGLRLLGFDAETVMQHHQRRCILGIRLCPQARELFLRKEPPMRYIEHPEEFRDATNRIAAFWSEPWLARRLDHAAWKLSERIPVERDAPGAANVAKPPVSAVADTGGDALDFWRKLARAGSPVCSDEQQRPTVAFRPQRRHAWSDSLALRRAKRQFLRANTTASTQ